MSLTRHLLQHVGKYSINYNNSTGFYSNSCKDTCVLILQNSLFTTPDTLEKRTCDNNDEKNNDVTEFSSRDDSSDVNFKNSNNSEQVSNQSKVKTESTEQRSYTDSNEWKPAQSEEGNGDQSVNEPPPPLPEHCCETGCPSCVWIEYAEDLVEYYADGGVKAIQAVNDNIQDPTLKSFILMELRMKGIK